MTGSNKEIDVAPCKDVIERMSDLSEAQKAATIDELPIFSDFLCPDIDSFDILGGIAGAAFLQLEITAT